MTEQTILLIARLIRHGRGILTAIEQWNVRNEEVLKAEQERSGSK